MLSNTMIKKILFTGLLVIGSVIVHSGDIFSQEKKDTLYSDLIPEPKIEFAPKHYVCYRNDEEINIDGKLNEIIWQRAEWTDYFVDIEGPLKTKPRFNTRAKMLWDDKYLYIAAELEEPHVWARLTQHDDVIFYDNDFEVFIDPDGDTHNYYEFEMNALNTYWDLLLLKPYRDQKNVAVDAWDMKGIKTAVFIDGTINEAGPVDDKKWTVEIAIPWDVLSECSQVGAPPKEDEQWRINFSRVEWQIEINNGEYKKVINPKTNRPFPEDNWVWSPQGIVAMHYPEMWGFVQFSYKVAGTGKSEFINKPEEAAKWLLRKVYYKERNYFAKNGKFTTDFNQLGLMEKAPAGFSWPPVIEVTNSMFEAHVTSISGNKKLHISNDGKTW